MDLILQKNGLQPGLVSLWERQVLQDSARLVRVAQLHASLATSNMLPQYQLHG